MKTVGKLKAKAAAARYRNPANSLRVIAVAGPYGKTTTACYLSELLQEAGHSVLTITNRGVYLNSDSTTFEFEPKASSLQKIMAYGRKKKADFIIVETHQQVLDSQVFSTITLEMSIITAQNETADELSKEPVAYTVVPHGYAADSVEVAPHQAITFGEDALADARVKDVKLYRKGTEIELVIDHNTKLQLATHLIGRANAYNIAAAVGAAYLLSIDVGVFEEGIARLEYVPGNYEYLPVDRLYDVVLDGANHMKSLELVVADAKKLAKRRLLVVADESVSPKYYSSVKFNSDALTAVGATDSPGIKAAEDTKAAVEVVLRGAKQEDTVLLIGQKFASRESDHMSHGQRLVEAASE